MSSPAPEKPILSAPLGAVLLLAINRTAAVKTYNATYSPKSSGLPTFRLALGAASDEGLLSGDGAACHSKLDMLVRGRLPDLLRLQPTEALKAACVVRALPEDNLPEDISSLTSLRRAVPLLAMAFWCVRRIRETSSDLKLLRAAAVRGVVEQFLLDNLPQLELPAPITSAPVKDDLVIALFEAASGRHDSIELGLEGMVARALNRPLTGSNAQKWRSIVVGCALESVPMASTQTAIGRHDDFVRKLSVALSKKSARTASGWIAIGDAHRNFVDIERMPLATFKEQVAAAAIRGLVELSPVSVGSLVTDDLRDRSEVELGGLTYHFVRIVNSSGR